MNEKEPTEDQSLERQPQPYHVRLPGFLIEGEMGLGDIVKKITYSIGVQPCSGCEKRAAALNRWMRFSR